MARKGRKRKTDAERVPGNGRLSRAGASVGLTNIEIRRIRAFVQDGGLLPETLSGKDHASQLWFLSAQRKIEEPAHRAGVRLRELHSKYQRAIGMKNIRCAGIESGLGGAEPDPDSCEGQNIAERETKSILRYEVVRASMEPDLWGAVFDLVIKDELLDWPREQKARIGLNMLAIEFGYVRGVN